MIKNQIEPQFEQTKLEKTEFDILLNFNQT